MTKTRSELWQQRWWNDPAGRVAWWIQHASGQTGKAAARAFYSGLIVDVGPAAARQRVEGFGVVLPSWLVIGGGQ